VLLCVAVMLHTLEGEMGSSSISSRLEKGLLAGGGEGGFDLVWAVFWEGGDLLLSLSL
jgi:hypothetical protein